MEAPIYSKKELMNEDWGYNEVAHSVTKGSKKAVVLCKDNGVVSKTCNYYGS